MKQKLFIDPFCESDAECISRNEYVDDEGDRLHQRQVTAPVAQAAPAVDTAPVAAPVADGDTWITEAEPYLYADGHWVYDRANEPVIGGGVLEFIRGEQTQRGHNQPAAPTGTNPAPTGVDPVPTTANRPVLAGRATYDESFREGFMNMDGALFHISPSDNNPWMYAAHESSNIGIEGCRRILERLLERLHVAERYRGRTLTGMVRRPPSPNALWMANRRLVTGEVSFPVWVAEVRDIVRMYFAGPYLELYDLPLDQVIYLLPIGFRLNYEDLVDAAVRDVRHFSVAPTANRRGANPEGALRGVGTLLSRFRDLPAPDFRIPIMEAAYSVGGIAPTIINVTRSHVNHYQWDNIVAASELTHVETDRLTDDPNAGYTPVHF